jgi:uncharacterized membrane protein YfcA
MSVYLPIAQLSIDIFLLLGLGAIAGILSGLFGIGGGFLMTPMLIFIGVPPAIAVSSVTNQMIASSISGFYPHFRKKNIDFKMGSLMLIGGFIGSSFGVWLFRYLSKLGQIDLIISIAYVFFLSFISFTMIFETFKRLTSKGKINSSNIISNKISNPIMLGSHHIPLRNLSKLPFTMHFPTSNIYSSPLTPIFISALIGILVSMLGIGGGFFMIPAMLYILKMPARVVIGTSLFQMIIISANVTLLHAISNHTVDILLAFLLLIGSSVGAQFGVKLGLKLPAEKMRLFLAILILGVALQLLLKLTLRPDDLYEMNLLRVK